jgi:2-polyprenyl-3-methyl-5-hydroxy-6-metoxy-1,4-benzoquinol methylase
VSDRSTEDFYDALANEYHLIFDDWWSSAQWQGQVLAQLLAAEGVAPPARVLDCTCGIGTQALPLAGLGYAMTGIDLSEASIDRATFAIRLKRLRHWVSHTAVSRQPKPFSSGKIDVKTMNPQRFWRDSPPNPRRVTET